MGRKNKRRGVVWGADPVTGSPIGEEVHSWDGQSRTSKRLRVRAELDERRETLIEYTELETDLRQRALQRARLELTDQDRDSEVLSEALMIRLERLAEMKRGGAKQREFRHIAAELDAEEWESLMTVLRLARESFS